MVVEGKQPTFSCRMYEERYPEVDEVVMVQVSDRTHYRIETHTHMQTKRGRMRKHLYVHRMTREDIVDKKVFCS